jgi:hypothetical protein
MLYTYPQPNSLRRFTENYRVLKPIYSLFGLLNSFVIPSIHGVTVSELLFSGGLGRCFWGSANQFLANRAPSALRTTHRSIQAPRTYWPPTRRLPFVILCHLSTSAFPPCFLRGHQEARGTLWTHASLKMYLKSALILRSFHLDSLAHIIHSLVSQPSSSPYLKSSSFSRALVTTVVPSSLSQLSFHPP